MAECYGLNFLPGIDGRETKNLYSLPISLILTDEKKAELNVIRQRALDLLKALQNANKAAEAELDKLQGDLKIAANELKKANKIAVENREDIISWEEKKQKQIDMDEDVRKSFEDNFLDEMKSSYKILKSNNGYDIKLNEKNGEISLQRTNNGHINGDAYTSDTLKNVNRAGLVDNIDNLGVTAKDVIPPIVFGIDVDYELKFSDLPNTHGLTEKQYLDFIKNGFSSNKYNCKIDEENPELCKLSNGIRGGQEQATKIYNKLQADKAMKADIKKKYECVKDPNNSNNCLMVKSGDGKKYPVMILKQQLEDYKKTFIGFSSDNFMKEIANSLLEIQTKIEKLPNQYYVAENDYSRYVGIKIKYFDDLKIINTPIRFDLDLPIILSGVSGNNNLVDETVKKARENCYYKSWFLSLNLEPCGTSGGDFDFSKYEKIPVGKFWSYTNIGFSVGTLNDSGIGVYKYPPSDECPHGAIYEGSWLANTGPVGKGLLTCTDKTGKLLSTYKGDWLNGKKHGLGEYNYFDSDRQENVVYSGEFLDGKKSGMGKLERKIISTTSGTRHVPFYEGKWLNDKFDGYGNLTRQDGKSLYGFWAKNILYTVENIEDGVNIANMPKRVLKYVPFSLYQKYATDGIATNLKSSDEDYEIHRYIHNQFKML
jgi:hypothetical protein